MGFFLQTISRDWEGLRTSDLAQRWRLVRWWCARCLLGKVFLWQKVPVFAKTTHPVVQYRRCFCVRIRGATVRVEKKKWRCGLFAHFATIKTTFFSRNLSVWAGDSWWLKEHCRPNNCRLPYLIPQTPSGLLVDLVFAGIILWCHLTTVAIGLQASLWRRYGAAAGVDSLTRIPAYDVSNRSNSTDMSYLCDNVSRRPVHHDAEDALSHTTYVG